MKNKLVQQQKEMHRMQQNNVKKKFSWH